MFRKRPVIGITGPDEGGSGAWFFTALSVWLAGGKPVRITVNSPASVDELNGLIIGGGADVEPLKYGQDRIEKSVLTKDSRTIFEWILSILLFPFYWLARYFQHTKSATIDTDRDELELKLLKDTLRYKKPVLGICRGMQLMNVHFNGSLHQDIRGYYTESPQVSSIFPKKRVELKKGSKLAAILRTSVCTVNALHNQAIDKPGDGVELTVKEMNTNITQGLEHPDYPFVIGVQWHPEYLIQVRRQRRLFKELVRCANGESPAFKKEKSSI
ncbi:MAG: gamma-glutamyl-gamma-aminobutyrate hydrolase family protein [Bacteroidota bacterium]